MDDDQSETCVLQSDKQTFWWKISSYLSLKENYIKLNFNTKTKQMMDTHTCLDSPFAVSMDEKWWDDYHSNCKPEKINPMHTNGI